MDIRKLILEDVRCFGGRQEFEIRPITFLVGENSTGKSTVLGCLQTIYDFMSGRNSGIDFNVDPYEMGAFSQIVRRSNPTLKRFKIGLELSPDNREESFEYTLVLVAKEKGSEPIIEEQKITTGFGEAEFAEYDRNTAELGNNEGGVITPFLNPNFFEVDDLKNNDSRDKFVVRISHHALASKVFSILSSAKSAISRQTLFGLVNEKSEDDDTISAKDKAFGKFAERLLQVIEDDSKKSYTRVWYNMFGSESINLLEAFSFAPLRSKPQRTYNPLREEVSSSGDEIPIVLMNMFKSDQPHWKKLRKRLIEFGKASGLFTDIIVRRLGTTMGDPFQLQVKVKGPRANIIDVGYGVNQILPILVRILNSRNEKLFLLQQPEIHLHPKGQAELSSLLIESLRREKHNFVIETHSDAMINRARIEIMNGGITPEDVSLIYMEPVGNRVKVHNIAFDKQANLIGAPSSYRNFFINESDRLLGFSK